jgi:O-antigen/teichoic acid export membrane protein
MKNRSDLEINKGLKLLAKSSIIVFIGLFLSKILIYVYRIIIARYFGPEVYGLFSLSIMAVGWFIAFSSFGLSEGLLRYISFYRGKKQEKKINHIFKISLITLFFSGIISAVLLFFLSEFISINIFHNPDLIIFLQVFSILIPVTVLSKVYLSAIRSFEMISWHTFIINILQNAIKVVFLVLFILIGLKSSAVIFSYFLGFAGTLLAAYLVCRYKIKKIFKSSKLEEKIRTGATKALFSYSWPFMFISLVTFIFHWTDSFIIGYFKTAIEVGFYNAAVPLIALFGLTAELFMRLFFPLITKEYARKNFKVIKELSQQVGKWIFILNLPLFIIMFLFPGAIINILFGKEYLVAATALRILSILGFFSTISFISYNLLTITGRSKLVMIDLIIAAIINLVLNILLIPKYGINGAAFSTLISNTFFYLILVIQVHRVFSFIPIRKKIIKISFIALIPTIFLIFIKKSMPINLFSLILLGCSFFLLYLFLIFITKCFDKNDIMILKDLKGKLLRRK